MLESVKLILNAELIDFFDNQRKMVRSKIIIVIFSFEKKGPNFLYWSSMKLFFEIGIFLLSIKKLKKKP